MIKVIAKKPRKYANRRIKKGQLFEILAADHFNVEWMTHAPNQTKEAQQAIIALAKRRKDGTSDI